MQSTPLAPSPFVSNSTYALISSSPRLKGGLLPGGLLTSPYEILDYDATLTLDDPMGISATFQRTQKIRFLQDGVSAIMDHMWGDGVVVTHYDNNAGRLDDSFKDGGYRHLVVNLKRSMGKGETIAFEVVRKAMVGFTKNEEWLETRIDHPTKRMIRSVVFPRERPCLYAILQYDGLEVPLPVMKLAGGKTLVRFDVHKPNIDTPYTVRWSW